MEVKPPLDNVSVPQAQDVIFAVRVSEILVGYWLGPKASHMTANAGCSGWPMVFNSKASMSTLIACPRRLNSLSLNPLETRRLLCTAL